MMKPLLISLALVLASSAANAACEVEYKAKRSNPTQYAHETMTISDSRCTKASVTNIVSQALSQQGWTLLTVVRVSKTG